MGKKVLIAYGSKYGSTAEIAEKIGTVLSQRGFDVDVLSAENVRELSMYSAAVVGGAVYIGRWHKASSQVFEKARRRARRDASLVLLQRSQPKKAIRLNS